MRQDLLEETQVINDKGMRMMGIARYSMEELMFLGLGTAGEAGEIANVIKKMRRDGKSEDLFTKLKKEMADVYIYLSHMAESLGTTEDECVELKLTELKERWPWVWDDSLPQDVGMIHG